MKQRRASQSPLRIHSDVLVQVKALVKDVVANHTNIERCRSEAPPGKSTKVIWYRKVRHRQTIRSHWYFSKCRNHHQRPKDRLWICVGERQQDHFGSPMAAGARGVATGGGREGRERVGKERRRKGRWIEPIGK